MKKNSKAIISAIALIGAVSMMMTGCTKKTTTGETTPSTTGSKTEVQSETGASGAITVYTREDGSGTRGAFIELFGILKKDDNGNKQDLTTVEAVTANKTDVMLTGVASDDKAIGYVSLGSLNDTVKALKIDGVMPSTETVKDGSYKIARPFLIATKGEATGLKKDFIDFILAKEGQEVIAKSYIAISENATPYAGNKPSGKLTIAGSSSVTPIMEKLKEAYMAINANAQIELQQTDSTAGMTGAIDGTCDIGMASRDLTDKEKEKLTGTAIANDGIAVIVSQKNASQNATKEQIKSIFTGETTNWKDVK